MTTTEPLYVSLHIPKTGGSSLRQILEQRFGDRLQRAYNKREGWPILDDPACIHGHGIFQDFMDTIRRHGDVKWITFLRDPLRGAISGYFFGKRRHAELGDSAPFTDRGLETWLTHTEEFHFPDPPGYNHNRYSKWFEKRPAEKYDYIGITEAFDECLVLLYRMFDWEPLYYTPENVGGYAAPDLPESLVSRFRELNEKDYSIYDAARRRLDTLKIEYGAEFVGDLAKFKKQIGKTQSSEQEH